MPAAAIQAGFPAGAVPAGGLFAWLTSIAMQGLVPLVAAAGGAISAIVTWAVTEFLRRREVEV